MDGKSNKAVLNRERQFHNKTFSEGGRTGAGKYYAAARAAANYYEFLLHQFSAPSRVLECGCGLGSKAFELASSGRFVVGIDVSEVAILQASDQSATLNLENLAFVQGNAERLCFADSSFDFICGSGILHHLNVDLAARELSRILSEQGKAVFFEPLGHNPFIRLYRFLTPHMRSKDEHPLRIEDFNILQKYFRTLELRFFSFTTLLATPFRHLTGFKKIVQILEKIDEILFRSEKLRWYAWICVITLANPNPPMNSSAPLN
jgi:ubiquinone/menaquinone biosynthesis C-methylase UbiE